MAPAKEAGGGERPGDRGDARGRGKKLVSVPARRRQAAYGRGRGLSARRACTLFSAARSALGYRSVEPANDAEATERMKAWSAQYPRYGYRRIQIFLARNGHPMSPGRADRLWRLARLQVPRKRVAMSRPRPQVPTGANQVWSYDFVFDRCANGQQLKRLTVTDAFAEEGLAIDVDGRTRSPRVIEVLSQRASARGTPAFLRSDNGPGRCGMRASVFRSVASLPRLGQPQQAGAGLSSDPWSEETGQGRAPRICRRIVGAGIRRLNQLEEDNTKRKLGVAASDLQPRAESCRWPDCRGAPPLGTGPGRGTAHARFP